MSEQSAKPYLVRAICEWCADNGLTPYIAVKVDGNTRVPVAFVKNGEIVLNISTTATRKPARMPTALSDSRQQSREKSATRSRRAGP